MANEGAGIFDVKIIAQLLVAGSKGLHINDLHKKCQISPADKKNFQSQLYEMHNENRVLRLPGNNWALSDTATVAPLKTASQPIADTVTKTEPSSDPVSAANGDETSFDMKGNEFEEYWGSPRPKINLPGMPTFTSFKNSLQEYVQKIKAPIDLTYTQEKTEEGYFSIAHFAPMAVKSTVVQPTAKDAQAQAALDALKQLGYVPADTVYNKADFGVNRKRKATAANGEAVIKKPAVDVLIDENLGLLSVPESPTTTYKSKLQVISQQHHLAAPVYETIQHANGFFSTVTFNGKKFKSASFETRKKIAEQSAAHMCLFLMKAVSVVPIGYAPGQEPFAVDEDPISFLNDMQSSFNLMTNALWDNNIEELGDGQCTIPELIKPTEDIPTFPAKSKLQEFCQKNKMINPAYQTTVRADGSAISTVTVNGVNYTGGSAGTRKKAEGSAAAKACKDLLLGCFVMETSAVEYPVKQEA